MDCLNKSDKVELSIVVPVFNEEEFISCCLDSLISKLKTVKFKYEIIVIDNGSYDDTCRILDSYSELIVRKIKRSTVSYARNFGASISSGNILAFIDGDVVVTEEWVTEIESLIFGDRKSYFLTGCKCRSRSDGTWIERYWFSNLKSSHINSGNLVISKSAFDEVRGFNESLKTGEDVDICDRVKLSNSIVFYVNERLTAIHMDYPKTLMKFFLREFWHGEGDFKNIQFFLKSKVALVSCVYGMLSALFFILSTMGYASYSLTALLLLVLINVSLTVYRFKNSGLEAMLFCFSLNYIYFIARFFALFRAVYNKKNRY